jgi:striatin 1/3/4
MDKKKTNESIVNSSPL